MPDYQTTRALLAASALVGTAILLRRMLRKDLRPSLKLTYFDMPGFGDHVRLTLAVGGIVFEDERIDYAEVARRRATGELPFGQVPVVSIDGHVYAQSNALLRYFGRLAGLYPEGVNQLRCDMAVEAWMDVDTKLVPQHYKCALSRSPNDGKPRVPLSDSQQADVAHELNQDALPTMLVRIGKVLKASNGPWYCGEVLTIADIKSYVVVTGLSNGSYAGGIDSAVLDGCPELREHAARVGALPAVRRWVEAHVVDSDTK